MKFRSIGFQNFRNLSNSLIPTDSKHVVLIGSNGQGKTNFLEAIYLLCYGSSFRSVTLNDIATHGEKNFILSGVVEGEDGTNQNLALRYGEGKREIRIDGREIKDRRDLIYNIPCIVFSHDDIEFIRGTPESRRRFFDQTLSLYDPLYFDDLRRYRAVLKQRNAAIKEGYTALLGLYDAQLAEVGIAIQKRRREATKEFNKIFTPLYNKISRQETTLKIVYKPSWDACNSAPEIVAKLGKSLPRDLKQQTTTSGIHRDQFTLMDGPVNFSSSGSTGQMRLASLIFRIVQIETYRKKGKKSPILLVDDVLLEMDSERRGEFLKELTGYSQAFFTFLPEEHYFSRIDEETGLTYGVEEGVLTPQ
ncbi:MAG: DNA replication and repair protein RecF [Sphaerochaetaceae bacterium]